MIIPACFSNPNTISGGSQTPQNLTTCIYQTHLFSSPTYLTLTWSKSLYAHSLTLHAPECFSITISLYPSTFSFFKKSGSGSKTIFLTHPHSSSRKIKLIWDFTQTIFTNDSAEPEASFYLAISCNDKVEFFLGDLHDELIKRIGATHLRYSAQPSLLSRRQHVFGRRSYVSRAQFLGIKHEIGVHCSGGMLKVKVDGKTCLVVKRLAWKFRGNEKIFVGATEVEFFWDVFNWVNRDNSSGKNNGHGVFVFQVGDGGVLPEMVGPEKKLMKKSLSAAASPAALSPSPSCSSVLQWAEETNDGCRSSFSSVKSSGSSRGFSLQLYAWKTD